MLLALILAADLTTTAPAQPLPPAAQDALALDLIKVCMEKAAGELDDHLSDAATIAQAVGDRCASYVQAYYLPALARRGVGPGPNDVRDLSRRMALTTVLKARKGSAGG